MPIEYVKNKVKEDLNEYQVSVRRIASSTNQRTLIASLIPPLITSMNVQTQINANKMDMKNKLFILGVLNSYVLDLVLRSVITSSSVSLTSLYTVPLPNEEDFKDSNSIIQIVKELLKENKDEYGDLDALVPGEDYQGYKHDTLIAELNARVMIDFGITRQEAITLMRTFKSAKYKKFVQEETQRIIDCYDRLSEGDQNE